MTGPGTFKERLRRAPRPLEPERAAEIVGLFPDQHPDLKALLAGTCGSSPYLFGLAERERAWLDPVLEASPEAALDAILAEAASAGGTGLGASLRRAKRRVALLVALADLGGIWSLEAVTEALTRLADLAVDRGIAVLVEQEIARGKIPGMSAEAAAKGAGMVAMAMGKMGARELNYSSDIDLICLFDESRFDAGDYHDARAAFVRVTRRLAALLSDATDEGYVFRTDLRLRPDPAVTPVCLSMEAAERYYESVGRTWERAAWIKARPAGGDIAAGEAFLKRLTPFVFRRHLDYAAIQDAHDMRLRIRDHKALGGRLKLENHDIKLGSGGIREIEFYTQTRQIIAGGRDPDLRARETVEALRGLGAKGWTDDGDALIADYRAHREVEHRLQMIADQQTHRLPGTPEGFDRLAALMDRDVGELRDDLLDRLNRVAGVTEGFFHPGGEKDAPDIGPAAAEIVARWPSYPALRSSRAAQIFKRVKPEILTRLSDRAARPEEALVHVDGFLAGLPAGVQLFSLFDANPQLIDLVVDIAATSPALAGYLSRHSDVLDAVIGGGFFADWPGPSALSEDLDERLGGAADYEAQLLAARRWKNEWHFRVGVHHLRGLIDGRVAGKEYAELAGAVLSALWPVVAREFARKHGPPPGRGASVLGMGSLGASSLTTTSDLDLIVIYDPGDAEMSDGPRPLAPRTYYARLTQAFVTALTAPMGPGRLYEVDMRLRPSGKQGPVATSLSAFKRYQREEAWTWEHLSLTRARPVAGDTALGSEVDAFRRTLIGAPRDGGETLADVAAMRARLAGARPGGDAWNVKDGAGRMQDIALLAQAGALLTGCPSRAVSEQLAAGAGALGLGAEEEAALSKAHALFWSVQAAERLMTEGAFDPSAVGAGGQAFVLRETGFGDMASLERGLAGAAETAAEIVARCLPEGPGEEGEA